MKAQFEMLQKSTMKLAQTKGMAIAEATLAGQRHTFQNAVAAMKGYEIATRNITSGTEDFTQKITAQKATFRDLINNRHQFNQILKEQWKLQNAIGIQWTKNAATGKYAQTLIMPDVGPTMRMRRAELGLFGAALDSASTQMVNWGKNTQWAGRQLMVGFTVPVAIASVAVAKMSFDFDKQLTRVVKVYGDASSGFVESSESIRESAVNTAKQIARAYGQSSDATLQIMGDLAASGKAGAELQQATLATSRAAVLGELEWQDAVKATITLQNVYRMSAQEVGDAFNYINAMENQTVLSAQDFVTAIPKVSGIMQELGASLQDTGSLMAAFKAAGIEAAEGANALKSISFRSVATYGKGLDTFLKETNTDLKDIIAETKGEVVPTLMAMAEAMENLAPDKKIAVARDVFGIYQGSKALMLLEQMFGESEQWARAQAVGLNTIAENAAIANAELERMNERPYMRIQKAVAEMQIVLQAAGETILEFGAGLAESVASLFETFGKLSGPVKFITLAMVGLAALAGPIIMLIGLSANLVAQGARIIGKMIVMGTQFKLTTVAMRMQALMSGNVSEAFAKQVVASGELGAALRQLAGNYDGLTDAQRRAAAQKFLKQNPEVLERMRVMPPEGYTYNPNNKNFYREAREDADGNIIPRAAVKNTEVLDKHITTINALGQRSSFAADNAEKLSRGLGAVGMMASVVTMSLGETDGVMNGLVNTMFALSMAMSAFPALGAAAFGKLSTGFGKVTGKLKAGIAALGQYKSVLLGLGGIIGAVGLGALAVWNTVNDSIEENKQNTQAYLDMTKELAELLGLTYNAAPSLQPDNKMTQNQAAIEMAAKYTATESGQKAAAEMARRAGTDQGLIWGEALAQGISIKLHGGTAQAAKDTTRIALAIMGQTFENDADFEIKINKMINFDDPAALIREQVKVFERGMNTALADVGDGSEGWWNTWVLQDRNLTGRAAIETTSQLEKYWNLVLTAEKGQREALMKGLDESVNKEMRANFDKLMREHGDYMREHGIDTYGKFYQNLAMDRTTSQDDQEFARIALDKYLGFNGEQQSQAMKKADYIRHITTELQRITKIPADDIAIIAEKAAAALSAAPEGKISVAEAMKRYAAEMQAIQGQGIALTDELRLVHLNEQRVAAGLERTGNVYDGFGKKTKVLADEQFKLADALAAAGVAAAITEDVATNAYRGIMKGTQDELFSAAKDSLEAEMDAEIAGIESRSEKALAKLEKDADDVEKKYDRLEKDQKKKQRDDEKAFEASQKRAQKTLEATYDARTKLIEGQIEALEQSIEVERRAEEQRQRIFEAERTRIQRLSELYNMGIDINAAINTGDLDQAAKLTNDVAAQQMQWANEDFRAVSGDASDQKIAGIEKRIDQLKSEKDSIEEIKKARLEALRETQEAEKEAFRERQELQRENLKIQRDAELESIRISKETEEEAVKSAVATAKKKWEARQRGLDQELQILQEALPVTEQQMTEHIKKLEIAYGKYGDNLKANGEDWGLFVSDALARNVAREGANLSSVINWANAGAEIANAMIKGAFGMTPQQFTAWLNGGAAPGTSPFNPNNAGLSSQQIRKKYGNVQEFHTGGVVGGGGGAIRTSTRLKSNEVPSVLLKNEAVLTEAAKNAIGGDRVIHALNSGRGVGAGGDNMLGLGSLPGAFMAGAAGQMLGQVLVGLARNKMQQSGTGVPGTDLGSATSNGKWIFNKLRSLGFTPQSAAGIIGNLMQESRINPRAKQPNGPGRGIMQWTEGDRWARLVRWAGAQGRDPWNLGTQFDFMIKEMKDYGVYTVMRGTSDVGAATRLFEVTMEKAGVPNMERRIAYALEAFRAYGNSFGLPGAPTDFLGSKVNLVPASVATPGGVQYSTGREITLGRGLYTGGINPANYVRPIPGRITSGYGPRGLFGGMFHNGIDIGAPGGTPIKAASNGRVLYSGFSKYGYGNYVLLQHPDGTITGYGHMSKRAVSAGQSVGRAQVIGYVGTTGLSTGNHLHFQTGRNGAWFNPRSALPQLKTGGFTLNDGLAMLHKNETVLTSPLTDKLKVGLDNLAQGDTNKYNVTVDMRGAVVRDDSDIRKIKNAVREVMSETERKNGPNRRIGR